MERPDLVGVDIDRPSVARMWDYFLGGSHNFAVDRRAAAEAERAMPELPLTIRASRSFLRRAVRYCVEAGIDQFLDLGSGIPTVGNVHQVAHRANARASVIYTDIDPMTVTHGRQLLAGNPRATIVQADLRDPGHVFGTEAAAELIDLRRPVAIVMVAVLNLVPDPAREIVSAYRELVAPGSMLALLAGSLDEQPAERGGTTSAVGRVYARTANPLVMRSRPEIIGLFDGFELVEPGLVRPPAWRPEGPEGELGWYYGYAGVGRKPA
jgi:SAM-dependent methyltransferase